MIDEEWTAFVERCVMLAENDLPALRDTKLLAFELIALLDAANRGSLLHGTLRDYDFAEEAMHARLVAAGADPEILSSVGHSST